MALVRIPHQNSITIVNLFITTFCEKIRFRYFIILLGFGSATAQQPVWPQQPAKARIAYEEQITEPSKLIEEDGFWDRVKRMFGKSSNDQFLRPMGIDAKGEILAVADAGAGGVFLINLSSKKYRFLVHKSKTVRLIPIDVAIGKDKIYIAYSQNKNLDVFDLNGKYLKKIKPQAIIDRLTGIFFNSPYLYLIDTPNHQVIAIDESGVVAQVYGQRGDSDGTFNYPTFGTSASDGRIYITDTMNFRVQVFNKQGEWIKSIGERGIMSGQFNRPKGVALDDNRNIYVVDGSFDNFQIFSPEGKFLLHIGGTGHQPGQFIMPTDIAINGNKIYISDTKNQRVQIFRMLYE